MLALHYFYYMSHIFPDFFSLLTLFDISSLFIHDVI